MQNIPVTMNFDNDNIIGYLELKNSALDDLAVLDPEKYEIRPSIAIYPDGKREITMFGIVLKPMKRNLLSTFDPDFQEVDFDVTLNDNNNPMGFRFNLLDDLIACFWNKFGEKPKMILLSERAYAEVSKTMRDISIFLVQDLKENNNLCFNSAIGSIPIHSSNKIVGDINKYPNNHVENIYALSENGKAVITNVRFN